MKVKAAISFLSLEIYLAKKCKINTNCIDSVFVLHYILY